MLSVFQGEMMTDKLASDDNIEKQLLGKTNIKTNIKEEKPLKEIGGALGPEPTRYGDWERNGRVSDF